MAEEKKICPYCYKSIARSDLNAEEDQPCPHSDCMKTIPKIYLQHPTKHVASIINKNCKIRDFGYEIADYAKNENAEGTDSRAESYDSEDENIKFILYEHLKNGYKSETETVVLAIHRCFWDSDSGLPVSDIKNASSILLNLDISELRALYFNLNLDRSKEDFKNWEPRKSGRFVREVSDYLRRNELKKKVAILFGNLQYLRRHPYVNEEKRYLDLLEITKEWVGDDDERDLIKETNNTNRDLLMELEEDRIIKDADTMSGGNFFLYPSSAYRMASNTFWMLAVLLWICI